INHRRVWAGGAFALAAPVKVTHLGIEITRSANGTQIKFPSGYSTEISPDWQLIEDPTPEPVQAIVPRIEAAPEPQPQITPDDNDEPSVAPLDLPDTASIIPVDAKKDDTLEIPISQIDFGPQPDDPPPPHASDSPGVFKIPVRGPDTDS
ncbi:MAG: hypothetical protein ABI947_21110, partial [Chloroflexota bacterium]